MLLELHHVLILLFSFFISANTSHAFPEMIRAGYPDCITCHVSPNGGGILNQYGRQSSASVLSTWGTENEAKPFYNLFKDPEWLDLQAYIRGVQTATWNSNINNGYFWWMEADGEGAARFGKDGKWTADIAIGISPDVLNGLQVPGSSPLLSPRHYLLYRIDDYSTVRAGKFIADYGVYFPDHTIPTRQGIGFDQGMETYNLEYSYQGEKFSASVTADLGRIENPDLTLDKGVAATAAIPIADTYKIGYSAFFGTENSKNRELTGPYALLGFTKRFYLLGECDFQFTQPPNGASTRGVVSYERLGYEVFPGFHLYLLEETSVYDFNGNFDPTLINPIYGIMANRQIGVGPGIYWYPRPHFYIQLEAQEQYSPSIPSTQTSAFLVGNIYF